MSPSTNTLIWPISSTVILKIRTRSRKSNQVFIIRQCYTLRPPAHEIPSTQESVTLTESAPKLMSPSTPVRAVWLLYTVCLSITKFDVHVPHQVEKWTCSNLQNIARSERSSHTPGGSHQRLKHFQRKDKIVKGFIILNQVVSEKTLMKNVHMCYIRVTEGKIENLKKKAKWGLAS